MTGSLPVLDNEMLGAINQKCLNDQDRDPDKESIITHDSTSKKANKEQCANEQQHRQREHGALEFGLGMCHISSPIEASCLVYQPYNQS